MHLISMVFISRQNVDIEHLWPLPSSRSEQALPPSRPVSSHPTPRLGPASKNTWLAFAWAPRLKHDIALRGLSLAVLGEQHRSSLGTGLSCWDQSQLLPTPHLRQTGEAWPPVPPLPLLFPCWKEEAAFLSSPGPGATSGEWPRSKPESSGGWGRDGEGGTGLRTIAGSPPAARPPQPTFLGGSGGRAEEPRGADAFAPPRHSPRPELSARSSHPPSAPPSPPQGSPRCLQPRLGWARGQGLDVSPPHWIRGSERGG